MQNARDLSLFETCFYLAPKQDVILETLKGAYRTKIGRAKTSPFAFFSPFVCLGIKAVSCAEVRLDTFVER